MSVEVKPQVDQFDDLYGHLLDKREMARHLKKSTRSVENLMRQRVIPFIKVGGQPRFRLKDVERALERYTVKEISL